MKHLMVVLCAFLAYFPNYAQFPSELWHQGSIVLVNNDTIRGNIKYDLDRDIIQINNEQGVQAFTAKKVLCFTFLDETSASYRQFYALPFQISPEYKSRVFFEVLLEGKMTLIARELIVVETLNYGNPFSSGSFYSQKVMMYRYYFLDDKGIIVRFYNNKKELYQIFKQKESQMRQYIKRNKFRFEDKSEMIRLTQYYNSLITTEK